MRVGGPCACRGSTRLVQQGGRSQGDFHSLRLADCASRRAKINTIIRKLGREQGVDARIARDGEQLFSSSRLARKTIGRRRPLSVAAEPSVGDCWREAARLLAGGGTFASPRTDRSLCDLSGLGDDFAATAEPRSQEADGQRGVGGKRSLAETRWRLCRLERAQPRKLIRVMGPIGNLRLSDLVAFGGSHGKPRHFANGWSSVVVASKAARTPLAYTVTHV